MAFRDPFLVPCVGESQRPLVPHGSLVELSLPAESRIRAGDLVVFRRGERVVCHRVLWRRRAAGSPEYLMKGDANLSADGWVPASAVVGKVVAINGTPVRSWRIRALGGLLLVVSLGQHAAGRAAVAAGMAPALKRRLSRA